MTKPLLFLFFLIIALPSFSQKKYTLSGIVKDEATGEQLIGATIRIKEIPQSGTLTNNYGFYSISASEGEYTLLFSYIGYETVTRQVSLHQSQAINISLSSRTDLKEVVINANAPNNDNIVSP